MSPCRRRPAPRRQLVQDGTIVFSPRWNTGLMKVSANGGTPVELTTPDQEAGERTHRWPDILPDGKTVLFVIGTLDSPGDYEDAPIAIVDIDTGERRMIGIRGSIARYVSSGHIIYSTGGVLMAVPFDLARLEIAGSPATVQDGGGRHRQQRRGLLRRCR